jgi:hypothetical protein
VDTSLADGDEKEEEDEREEEDHGKDHGKDEEDHGRTSWTMGCVCSALVADPKEVQIWSWLETDSSLVACDRCGKLAAKPWRGLSGPEKAAWRIILLQQSKTSLATGVSQPLDDRSRNKSRSRRTSGERTGSADRDEGRSSDTRQISTTFVLMCLPCAATYQKEVEQFKKERQYYANAKAMLYPKERLRTALRRIATGEQWENTESFHAKYKPDSVLERLGEEEDRSFEDVDSMLSGEGDVTIVVEESIERDESGEREDGQEDGEEDHEDHEDHEDGESLSKKSC